MSSRSLEQGVVFSKWNCSLAAPALFALLFVALVAPSTASAKSWTKPGTIAGTQVGILAPAAAAGPRGYGVAAWVGDVRKVNNLGRIGRGYVSVKLPGRKNFGRPVRFTNSLDIGSPLLDINQRGTTVLTWAEPDGRQMVRFRNLRKGWTKATRIRGGDSSGALVSIGPDGTVALAGTMGVDRLRTKRLVMAVKRPGRRFSRWFRVSEDPADIGHNAKIVAGTRGRATLVFSPPCPVGPVSQLRLTHYVDVVGTRAGRPRAIGNSKCVTFDLDLERDAAGYQYLRIGGSTRDFGTKLSIRRPGQGFPPAELMNLPEQAADGGDLTVNSKGQYALIWNYYNADFSNREAYVYVNGRRDKTRSAVRKIANLEYPDDYMLDAGMLPNGSITTFWKDAFLPRHGTGHLKPGVPFAGPSWDFPGQKENGIGLHGLEVGPDGSRFVWWVQQSSRDRNYDFQYSMPRSR